MICLGRYFTGENGSLQLVFQKNPRDSKWDAAEPETGEVRLLYWST